VIWKLRNQELPLDKPLIMGILNITPDSFSDGGDFFDPTAALARAEAMVSEGADILDVGAESTRPGSAAVSPQEQRDRLRPVLRELGAWDVPISVDTTNSLVAAEALETGVQIVNDISSLEDPSMAGLVAQAKAGLVLMHMRGRPKTMQESPRYEDVVSEVEVFLTARRDRAMEAGVPLEGIAFDPGIGFGKTLNHNLALIDGLGSLVGLGSPVLVGLSRKRFIGELSGNENPRDRLAGSLAAAVTAHSRGAHIFRVHDVAATREALSVAHALRGNAGSDGSRQE
jgi:dihydropteroate synthase